MPPSPVICLMGPTATGKTEIAVRLRQRYPIDIISVDSAMVYRGMDIGTAKPTRETLIKAPHGLIDIRDPEQSYSAGDFVAEANREIESSHAAGRIPLLVGGTMMYFRSLTEGLADLPSADVAIRQDLDAEAKEQGWPQLHARLATVDPAAARRINANDAQRIQRALEVYEISGITLTAWHESAKTSGSDNRYVKFAVLPSNREQLQRKIAKRLEVMLEQGFLDELRDLRQRPGLSAASPSMRAVGYRQFWAHLAGECTLQQAQHQALVATRQLAKRQMTWLRTERQLNVPDPLEVDPFDAISAWLAAEFAKLLDE